MSTSIDTLLVSSPEVSGGRLRLGGTRITVNQIVVWYKQGYSPEEIADQYSQLTLAQVYAALAHYHANTAEVETDLSAEQLEAESLERDHRQALGRGGRAFPFSLDTAETLCACHCEARF